MNVADYIIAFLGSLGVRHVFGYPGTPLVPLLAALERQTTVRWVLMRHENAAALARNSYWSPDRVEQPDVLLAAHLRGLVDDPARRRRLGAFSRTFAEQRFGLTAMAERLADVYAQASSYTARSWLADLPTEARRLKHVATVAEKRLGLVEGRS